jgi:hypothetical protein
MTLLRNLSSGSLLAVMMLAVGAAPASASHDGIFELFIHDEPPDYYEPPAERRKARKGRSGSIFDLFDRRRELQTTGEEPPVRKQRKLTSKPAQKKAKASNASRLTKVRQAVRKAAALEMQSKTLRPSMEPESVEKPKPVERQVSEEKPAIARLPSAVSSVSPPKSVRNDPKPPIRKIAEEKPRLAALPKASEPSLPRKKPAVAAPPPPDAGAAKPGPARLSCEEARTIISKYAFSSVTARSCSGDTYSFAAMRGGKPYAVKISALTGELVEVKRGAPQTGARPKPAAEASYNLVPKPLLPNQ